MTQTADLIHKMAEFFRSEEFFEKGEDARLELSPDDVRCMNRIIKACGNGVNRQTVLDMLEDINAETEGIGFYYEHYVDYIKSLPSVKPQEPKTVLYSGDGYADGEMVYDMAECPNCGYEYEDGDKDWGLSFCPNCGQKLDWERSDKE